MNSRCKLIFFASLFVTLISFYDFYNYPQLHANGKTGLIIQTIEANSQDEKGKSHQTLERTDPALLASEANKFPKVESPINPLTFLASMEDLGCIQLDSAYSDKLDYLETDFTDCVLFCLGRNYSRVLTNQNSTAGVGNDKLKCFCNDFLESYDNFSTDNLCLPNSFQFFKFSSFLPENYSPKPQNLSEEEEELNVLGCVDMNKIDVAESVQPNSNLFTRKMCRRFCDIQSYSLAFYADSIGPKAQFCSCSKTLRNVFRAQIPCPSQGPKVLQMLTPFATEQCSRARLLDESEAAVLPVVALFSVCGSGNTWTRLMIQHMTGFLTGSVYHDMEKVGSDLYGEALRWTEWKQKYLRTFIVKTHQMRLLSHQASKSFNWENWIPQKAIRVIRHPLQTAIAEFNRQRLGQYKSVDVENLSNQDLEYLSKIVRSDSALIISDHQSLVNKNIMTLFLSYEDMIENLLPQLSRIQHFLGFESEDYLERTFCAYFRKRVDEKIKRVYKADLRPKLLQFLDKESVKRNIHNADNFLRSKHLHFLRKQEYLDLLESNWNK